MTQTTEQTPEVATAPQTAATDLVTDKSFRMCGCGKVEPHGYFFKGGRKLPAIVLGKSGGRRLLELMLGEEMITEAEKVFLEAQVAVAPLPETFTWQNHTDVEAAEITFAEAMRDPLQELLSQLAESLGGNVQVIRS